MGALANTVSAFWALLTLYVVAAAAFSRNADEKSYLRRTHQGVDRRVVHWWRARKREKSY
jgi:hypothetical protein